MLVEHEHATGHQQRDDRGRVPGRGRGRDAASGTRRRRRRDPRRARGPRAGPGGSARPPARSGRSRARRSPRPPAPSSARPGRSRPRARAQAAAAAASRRNSRNVDCATMAETTVSATAVRRLAVAAQAYAGRYRRATGASVEAAIRRLPASSSTRSRRSSGATGSRSEPRRRLSEREPSRDLLGEGRIFEYWAHEACLLPIESWPLFRPRDGERRPRWYGGNVGKTHPHLADEILGRDPRARPARVAALRGRGRRRDVELEAGEGDARAALEPRRPRDRRPPGLPARLRPGRARDPAGAARRAGPSETRRCGRSPSRRCAREAR